MGLTKLQISFIAVTLLAALWIHIEFGGMFFFHEAYPLRIAKTRIIDGAAAHETLILGDSRAQASLDPAYFPGSASLALLGASPLESHVLLSEYLTKHPAPKRILYSMSPNRFSMNENFWVSTASLKLIPYSEAMHFLRMARVREGLNFSGESAALGYGLSVLYLRLVYLNFPLLFGPNLSYGGVFFRRAQNERVLQESLRMRGGFWFCDNKEKQVQLGRESGLMEFRPNLSIASYFEMTLDLARKKGIEVYFIAAPTSPISWDSNSPSYYEEFSHFLSSFAGRYPNFHIVVVPHRGVQGHFADQDHLNEGGAGFFSRALMGKLPGYAIRPTPLDPRPSMCP